jgi:hypothetical protein
MSKIVKIVVVVAIVALIVNDGGRLGQGLVHLRTSTGEVLDSTTSATSGARRQQVVNELSAQASTNHIRITQYSVDASIIHVWTEQDISGTWVIGPVMAIQRGVPVSKAWQIPIVIHYEQSAARS